MIELITFTTLYPNSSQPRHGLFVEQRLIRLLATQEVRSRVVAPVPWFPFNSALFKKYSTYSQVPYSERRHGVDVTHPRYLVVPKIGMSASPWLMARAVERTVRIITTSGCGCDLIDAHYFYPDGVAAVRIGRRLGKPVVVTARGSDVNLIPDYPLARRQIQWAVRHCAAIITVSQALKERLVTLGADGSRITVLRNGVDLERFHPVDREQARQRTGLVGPTLLSVGHLVEGKGHHIAIESLNRLPNVRLAIIGEGEMEAQLRRQARQLGVADRVQFVGPVNTSDLPFYYCSADALVLASRREGMANVVLESLACGTPVIGTAVGGTPEVVRGSDAGVLMERRDAQSLAAAYRRLTADVLDRAATRRYAQQFSWDATTTGQLELFSRLKSQGSG